MFLTTEGQGPNGERLDDTPGVCLVICQVTAAILVIACGSVACGQSSARADVQVGGAFLNTLPGLVMGGTGWINTHAGVATRLYFAPDHGLGNPLGIETAVRYRAFTGDVEIDAGLGVMSLKTGETIRRVLGNGRPVEIRRDLGRRHYVTIDALLGRRLAERFGLKVGVGVILGDGAVGFAAKLLLVLPIGKQ